MSNRLGGAVERAGAPPRKRRCLSLSVDDGYEEVVRDLLINLEPSGLKATFYLHGDRAPTSRRTHSRLACQDLIREALQLGHEGGAHSFHHLSWPALTHEERVQELSLTFRFWAEHGVIPSSFAYPYGHVDEATYDLVSAFFATAVVSFSVGGRTRDPHLLPRISVLPGWTETYLEHMLQPENANTDNNWKILMVHDLPSGDVRRLTTFVEQKVGAGWEVGTVSACWAAMGQ